MSDAAAASGFGAGMTKQQKTMAIRLLAACACLASGPVGAGPVRPVAQRPVGPAARRVNRALDAADGRLRAAAEECRTGARNGAGALWNRTVTVAMQGPRYLSLVAADEHHCVGPGLNAVAFTLAYDLRTGSPLDWGALLPPALAGSARTETAPDGTRIATVASPRLKALYIRAARAPDAGYIEADAVVPVSELRGLGMPGILPDSIWAGRDRLP